MTEGIDAVFFIMYKLIYSVLVLYIERFDSGLRFSKDISIYSYNGIFVGETFGVSSITLTD